MAAFVVDINAGCAAVTFDDGAMNLLSTAALRELAGILDALGSDIELLLLRSGRPNVFAAGADMSAMQQFDGHAAREFAREGQQLFGAIERLDALSAVIIDGDCYGGALDLALSFDLRLSTRRSRFSHPGARIGIVTGFGGTVRIPRLGSRAAVSRLMLDNAVISAEDAAQLGMVDELIEDPAAGDTRLRRIAAAIPIEARVARVLRRVVTGGAAERLTLARRTEELWRGLTTDGRP